MGSLLKEIYEVVDEYDAFYTGGEVAWCEDGSQLFSQCDDSIHTVDINTGKKVLTIARTVDGIEEDSIYTFALSHKNENIVTAHKSGLVKIWATNNGTQVKTWRAGHKGPITRLAFDITDQNVASGGSDGIVRLWDLTHQACTGSLKGAMGVFSVLKYHPDLNKETVFGAADDTKIRSWNSKTGRNSLIYSGHYSKVTSLQFTPDGLHMVSSGRDRVLILWDLHEGNSLKILPVYESIEGLVLLPDVFKIPNFNKKKQTEGIFVACGGEKGVIKVWNIQTGVLMYEQEESLVSAAAQEGSLSIVNIHFNKARNCLAVVTADQNIIMHELETFKCIKQMVGFSDEILDIIFLGKDDSHIVVATNSADLKYYELSSMNCQILKGHTDIVLALARFPSHPEMFISSGKDNSVRLWIQNSNLTVKCITSGTRHTASVGSVFTSQSSNSYFVSVSQDSCLKMWSTPKNLDTDEKLNSIYTVLAHQSDINSVTVSPNDKMVATGSQDKTAKLWSESLELLGVLKGHRRGVWSVRFSPVDQVLLTSSADSTIRLWSISELNCLKTLEGHESSVLKAEFLTRGLQILSCGADGLLKLWNIKTSECKMSLDNHEGKVWSMVVKKDESLVITGGSDSKLVKWKDVTVEKREKISKEREEMILQEQELMNLLHDKKTLKALKLALRLDRPFQVLKIINEVMKDGVDKLSETLKEINQTQKESLLICASEWNTNNKNCHVAQVVFNILAPEIISGDLKLPNRASFIEGVLPYSERHYERLTNLLQDLSFITYTVNSMQPHALQS